MANRFIDTLETILRKADELKHKTEPGLDKYLAISAANVAAVYGVSEVVEHTDLSDPSYAIIMMATGAVMAAGNYFTLRNKDKNRFRKAMKNANSAIDSYRPLSWLKTGIFLIALAYSSNALKPYVEQVVDDVKKEFKGPELKSPDKPRPGDVKRREVSRKRPEYYDRISFERSKDYDFSKVRLADKYSDIGRIQRTLRWQPIYRAVEQAYGMPEDILAGMIIQESLGDPVQPNSSNDGGLGLVHIQGTTARQYGLRIFGSSKTASDNDHGKQIKKMIEDCQYDPSCVQKYDERAHLVKDLDAGARIVTEGKLALGDWDMGVAYYRMPGKPDGNTAWRYKEKVIDWRKKIRDQGMLKAAADDFKRRNGFEFSEYLRRFHDMSDNWGLSLYKASK